MLYLYLDESGDLGFDFVNKKPSKYFTVAILAFSGQETNRALTKAVEKTLRRKINKKAVRIVEELKAAKTESGIKFYLYEQIKDFKFSLYAMTLNKKRVYEPLTTKKDRVYNWIAKQVLDQIPIEKMDATRIQLILDKSKGKAGIKEFNQYIEQNLKARIAPNIPLDIAHKDSRESKVLQIIDFFCWGIFQKYERRNIEWVTLFKEKIYYDNVYLK